MLYLTIPEQESFDSATQEFVTRGPWNLQLEHSLVSISKWESKYERAFLSKTEKTSEETLEYIKCMTISQNVKQEVYQYFTNENFIEIKKYIEGKMTATVLGNNQNNPVPRKETTTAELIYYYMITLNIPFEAQKWHLNRLLTLIQVCSIKNAPPKKMSKREIMARNQALNSARRQELNTRG